MLLLLYISSYFAFSLAENILEKHIANSIDWKVDPCDDFYRHVCQKNSQPIETVFNKPIEKMFKKAKLLGFAKETEEFKKLLEKPVKKLVKSFIKSAKKDFEKSCEINKNKAEEYLTEFTRSLTDISESVKNCVQNIDRGTSCKVQKSDFKKCLALINESNSLTKIQYDIRQATLEQMKMYKWILGEGSYAINRVIETFDKLKMTAMNMFEKTDGKYDAKYFQLFENSTIFKPVNTIMDILKNINTNFVKAAHHVESCVNDHYFNRTTAQLFCFVSYHNQHNRQLQELTQGIRNAFDPKNSAFFGENICYAAHNFENTAEYMGFAGTLVANDIGNSIMNELTDHNITRECVEQQFANSCEFFREGDCRVHSSQFENSLVDLTGLQIAFKMFNDQFKQPAQKKQKYSGKFPSGMTNEKLFFYAFGARFCDSFPTHLNMENQPTNVRVNAAVAQIPDFKNIFQCDMNSPMILSNKKQCSLFGSYESSTNKDPILNYM